MYLASGISVGVKSAGPAVQFRQQIQQICKMLKALCAHAMEAGCGPIFLRLRRRSAVTDLDSKEC